MDEELLSRQQPQSLEAEQAVLGSILIDSRCITDIIGVVQPEDFYLQQNKEIFGVIYSMFNLAQAIDPVTVLDKMREAGVHRDNSRDYIMQLMEITPTSANIATAAGHPADAKAIADCTISAKPTDASKTAAPSAKVATAHCKMLGPLDALAAPTAFCPPAMPISFAASPAAMPTAIALSGSEAGKAGIAA